MVKLSVDLLTKLGPGNNKRKPDETINHYLNRLTHIYLQEKLIVGVVSSFLENLCKESFFVSKLTFN
jgi:hypothetical protein